MADVMRSIPRASLKLASISAVALLLAGAPLLAAKEKPKTSVADLRYGVALYHYYQQDYLSALSELMVADARNGIQGHGDNPELIAGGISLAFGMQNHAQSVFNDILKDERRPQSVRDAAWFYLGKLHYTRGNWDAAEQSFARVSDEFKPNLMAQLRALQINIQIHKKNYSAYSLKKLDDKSLRTWNPYVLYNLGAAYAREGNFTEAQAYFHELSDVTSDENTVNRKEHWALQDKAYTAMGYSFLAQKKYPEAIEEFTRVRLEGMHANQALLGYGWAAVAQENYKAAIKPWQMLRSRSLIYPAVQESLLALPFAYEKLGAQGEALEAYQTAESLLEREIQLIKDMRNTLTDGELLTLIGSEPVSADALKKSSDGDNSEPGTLTAVVTDDGQNWLKLDKTSIVKTRSAYLTELFSQNTFQVAVLDLRDLLRQQKLLKAWQPKLDVYRDLLIEKQASRARNEQQLRNLGVIQKEQALIAERDGLQVRMQRIMDNNDYIALADDDTRDLYKLVERSKVTITRMKAACQDTADAETRLSMFDGILLWKAAQEYPARLADLQAAMNAVNTQLQQIQDTKARVQAITATSLDIQPRLARLQTLSSEIDTQLAAIDRMLKQQGVILRAQVDEQLRVHEKRLTNYLSQSHLAVARLYDAELRKQE